MLSQMTSPPQRQRLFKPLCLLRLPAILLMLCFVALANSCRPAAEAQPSKTQLLTNTSWIIRSTIPNVNELIQAVFVFTRDGAFQYITPDGTIAALGRWTFTDNETRVNVVISSTNMLQMDVLTLTAQEFRFRLSINGAIIECSCVPLR
jgi:hypothetical protein